MSSRVGGGRLVVVVKIGIIGRPGMPLPGPAEIIGGGGAGTPAFSSSSFVIPRLMIL